jgi:hypothetical protein
LILTTDPLPRWFCHRQVFKLVDYGRTTSEV